MFIRFFPPPRRIVGDCLLAVLLFAPVVGIAAEESEAVRAASVVAARPAPDAAHLTLSLDELLNLADQDPRQLAQVRVAPGPRANNSAAPSSTLTPADAAAHDVKTTSELIQQLPSVTNRRLSGINVDSRVRGYNPAQLNASVNGMTQRKTVQDLDSLFSQIDPGVLQDMTVIDGPYSALYGPGFAFLTGNLLSPPRYQNGPESHSATFFDYGGNGQTLYARENITAGAENWGMVFSYGMRAGSDYRSGGSDGFLTPTSYHKWDALLALSFDLHRAARIEFDYLRNEMNRVELPGIVYDLNNSTNNQFNIRYIVQEDRDGPEQLVLQTWAHTTSFRGDASREEKQQTYYTQLLTIPYSDYDPCSTLSSGDSDSLGVRGVRTFGEADSLQWTVGLDWRRYQQQYTERDLDPAGETTFAGNLFGVPRSYMDDVGALTSLTAPMNDQVTVTVGGRIDYAKPFLDQNDAVITEIPNPNDWYYMPGFSTLGRTLGMAYATGRLAMTERWALNVGTGYGMRMPELSELYVDDPFMPVARFGNSFVSGLSTLRPERNWQFDLGMTYREDRLSCGVRGFHSTLWDYVMPVPEYVSWRAPDSVQPSNALGRNFAAFPAQWRDDLGTPGENADTCVAGYQYENIVLATLFGGELFAQVPLGEWLSVYGNLGYVNGTNYRPIASVYSDSGNYVVPAGPAEGLPGIYPFHGKLAVRVSEPEMERWGLEFAMRMAAAQDHVAASLAELPSAGFAVFDLRGYYQLRRGIRVTTSVENLFNTYYSEPGSVAIIGPQGVPVFLPEPGISFGLGLEARF